VDNLEVFPAVVYSQKHRKEWSDYFAFNVIGIIDAVDLDKSQYDTIMQGNDEIPPMLAFNEVVFSAEKVKDAPKMFRLIQEESRLYVNAFVRDTYMKLSPPETWGFITTDIEVV
jgi:regulatory protein YycH of two-component signal transduction system YycFG